MAARRIFSLLAAKIPQKPTSRELSRDFHPSPETFYRSYQKYARGFHKLAESSTPTVENPVDSDSSSSSPDSGKANPVSDSLNTRTVVEHRVNSNLKVSERHDLVMMFTCKVCDTRSIKTACRESYDKGIVVARCDGCNNLHLIADRLGWFGEPGSVEDFLAARGEEVTKGSADTLNLTLEDLAGRQNLET